jgi:hypothetical protein
MNSSERRTVEMRPNAQCDEIAARIGHLMPTFGKSRYAGTNGAGRRLERLEDADGAMEELREAAESLVA